MSRDFSVSVYLCFAVESEQPPLIFLGFLSCARCCVPRLLKLRSLGARRSCPYLDTSPSPSTARHGSAPTDQSRYTAGPGRGGSTPRADACPPPAWRPDDADHGRQ